MKHSEGSVTVWRQLCQNWWNYVIPLLELKSSECSWRSLGRYSRRLLKEGTRKPPQRVQTVLNNKRGHTTCWLSLVIHSCKLSNSTMADAKLQNHNPQTSKWCHGGYFKSTVFPAQQLLSDWNLKHQKTQWHSGNSPFVVKLAQITEN